MQRVAPAPWPHGMHVRDVQEQQSIVPDELPPARLRPQRTHVFGVDGGNEVPEELQMRGRCHVAGVAACRWCLASGRILQLGEKSAEFFPFEQSCCFPVCSHPLFLSSCLEVNEFSEVKDTVDERRL